MNTNRKIQKNGNSTLKFIFLTLTSILLIFWIKGLIKDYKTQPAESSSRKENVVDTGNSFKPYDEPLFTEHITPCGWIENREFYLESDDPISMKFPGVKEVITYPGKGKLEIPAGRWKGPIKFFYRPDSLNGYKPFRIYPVK